ncbi:MAG: response regulator [Gemmobacter sp.]
MSRLNPSAEDADTDRLRDEFVRQAQFQRDETPSRMIASGLTYGLSLIFVPFWLIVCLLCLDLTFEVASQRLMRDPDRLVTEPARRRMVLILIFLVEAVFATPAVLIWYHDNPYAKALAVGILSGSMMHMATVRAIHLPQGLAGAAGLALMVVGSNVVYWTQKEDWQGLGLTSLCTVVAIGYFISAMISNNRHHRDNAARGRAAHRANAAKGRFLARMSHELRTPLNGILGIASAELRSARDPAARERLAVLVASAEGLANILDDSLDAAAVTDGRLPIRLRPTVPHTAVTVAAALFRHRIEEAGLALSLDIGPGLDQPALLDEHRLRQCLSNLLSNALRHTAEGGITVTARRGPAMTLDIEVADTGSGIAPARRDRLFELSPGTSAAPVAGAAGHGLGLGITRDLARQMGGDLVLLPARPDQRGAQFRLTVALPPAVGADVPARESAAEGPPPLSGLHVLVVDDLATNRLVAMTCLHLMGARTAEAASGAEALARLAAVTGGDDRVDAVLLDMNMPDMDGLQTLRAIRALPDGQGAMTVVAMTADAMPSDRLRFLEAGMDGYLAKPVTPERMAAALIDARLGRVAAPMRDSVA